MAGKVRDSVSQINQNSWLIGDKFTISRQRSPPAEYLWKDDGFWYIVTGLDPTLPLPAAEPLSHDTHIVQVHDAGDAAAVWSLGDAFLKVKLIEEGMEKVTPEHVTLKWLADQKLSFAVPKLLHHVQAEDRVYLVISRVKGKVLADEWRTMAERDKEHYANRIVEICDELSVWQSNAIMGVDGGQFGDSWLGQVAGRPKDYSSEYLQQTAKALGMQCSKFNFWHSDLGPHNIIVNAGCVGLIDWEIAGYVPREWIRTKFCVSWGMDFAWRDVHHNDRSLSEWRDMVQRKLGEKKYPQVEEAWKKWFDETHP